MDSQYTYSAINDQRNAQNVPPRDENSPSPEPGYTPRNNMASPIEISPLSNRGHFHEMFSEPRTSDDNQDQHPLPISTEPISERKKRRPGRRFDRVGSWTWEAGGCALSIVSIVLLVVFLVYVDGDKYASWEHSISPNTVVSVISTVAKASMLVPVSSCLSQLKWTTFHNPTPFYHMQVFDQASRGPVGALESLWTVTPGLATIGAGLMILAVAFDPFAQQILSYPARRMEVNSGTSAVQSADQYWPAWARSVAPQIDILNITTRGLEPSMQAAIFNGLAQSKNNPLNPICPSGDCEYDDFVTLGVCSQCKDVTNEANQSCKPSTDQHKLYTQEWMAEIPLDCNYTTPSGASITPGIWVNDAKWLSQDNYSVFAIPNPWSAVSLSNGSFVKEGDRVQIVSFLSAKYEGRLTTWTSKNSTTPEDKPTLMECSVSLCERKYTQTRESSDDGLQQIELVETQDFYLGENIKSNITGIWLSTLVSPNDTKPLSPNSNYTIENSTWADLSGTLTGLFNSTLYTADAQSIEKSIPGLNPLLALWSSTNLTDSVTSMANSMTDHIRTSTSAKQIPGTTFHTETYIHVRWAWIALPAILVLLAVALLLVVSVENRKYSTFLWKSSVLPLLLGKMQINSEHEIDTLQTVTDVQDVSKKIRIAVECEAPCPDFIER
ncbi:hypothetical protein N7509_007501 [Penicillium cosmopolitanum]|uniref:Uncharacterized protein n=1 Tax=Penicillium cosmopolitanum TaxID=1131564 RepID=A0A9W9VZ80_9EURO|nr:uncharacterized protein N7509_007501 [Penicillium cosmopolitanum]KAJ5392011.1 hypothetical protein N7509_007501 [Penicillium cosmopolitanum]